MWNVWGVFTDETGIPLEDDVVKTDRLRVGAIETEENFKIFLVFARRKQIRRDAFSYCVAITRLYKRCYRAVRS